MELTTMNKREPDSKFQQKIFYNVVRYVFNMLICFLFID